MLNSEVNNLDNNTIISTLQSSPSALDRVSKFGSLARVLGTTDSKLRIKGLPPQDCLYQNRSSPPLIDTTHNTPSKHETSDADSQSGRALRKYTHTSYGSTGGLSGTPSGELP